MLKAGLIGLGFMGRTHLSCYDRLEREQEGVRLVALCDIRPETFEGQAQAGNLDVGGEAAELTGRRLYTSVDEMLENEQLDFVDICLPTHLHAETAIMALNRGIHVICEKPMALTLDECLAMTEAAESNRRQLMIAHCLRFWPAYEYLKEAVESRRLGEATSAYFFRGGNTPTWTHENWMITEAKSGGSILDLHIHDADIVHWLFGKPKAVSTIARNVLSPESGLDIVSTHYVYEDGKVVNAQSDTTLKGGFGFRMLYRVNFERGTIVFEDGKVKEHAPGRESFEPELSEDHGYYREIRYFAECVREGRPVARATAHDALGTIGIVEKEKLSASLAGQPQAVE